MCYVTAKIITPAGLPLNEEEEEGLLPPKLPEVPAYKTQPRITRIPRIWGAHAARVHFSAASPK